MSEYIPCLINKEEIWKRYRLYDSQMTDAEKKLIRSSFYIYCAGNGIEEFDSSAHQENEFEMFKGAWIMSAIWQGK
jgi:hypothetical protein